MPSSSFRSLFSLAALLIVAGCASVGPQRIVAVGDIHGEYDGFVSILREAGLVDEKLRWIGAGTTFVQTGDYLDRGAEARKVMDLLMKLERSRGANVIVLLGNHELMNITRNLPDVNPAQYAAFAGPSSERRREAGYRDYAALRQSLAHRYPDASLTVLSEDEWMDAHPPGFIEYAEALSRNGVYGRWLRTKRTMVKAGDSIFMHAGISPDDSAATIDEVNSRIRMEIEAFDRIQEYLVGEKLILPFATFQEIAEVIELESKRGAERLPAGMDKVIAVFNGFYHWRINAPEGPLWFRGYGTWTEEEGRQHMDTLLERFGAKRFVVGHSIPSDPSQILPRFGGKVFLIDTAMLRGLVSNGRPSALEIRGDSVSAIYESGRVMLTTDRRMRYRVASLWIEPPSQNADEVSAFLREARVVKVERKRLTGATKPQKVLLEHDGVRAWAVFRSLHREEENATWESGHFVEFLRDSYRSEIAAYELSRMLDLETIPPAVPWKLKGRSGSLQIWIENARPGYHPLETRKPPDPERWQLELARMRVFDALIGNLDRHEGNVLVDSNERVWWIDHSRAFGRGRDLIASDEIRRCDRRLYERLKSIDPALVTERLTPYMSSREIEALLERRVKLLALIDGLIAADGEASVLYTLDD